MSTAYIYPYKAASGSVSELQSRLNIKKIRRENSRFVGNANKTVINWGNSELPDTVNNANVINKPEAVKLATNKRTFFEITHEAVRVPPFTTDQNVAKQWIEEGKKVVIREKLTGSSGEGIVLLDGSDEFEVYNHRRARLYVQYIPKKDEFRIHVIGDKITDMQQKKRSRDVPDERVNYQIRNHHNGFIFAREGIEVPEDVKTQALAAIQKIGLDFGAVDVIWNQHRQEAYVLEVNCAPGLENTTADKYAAEFNDQFNIDLNRAYELAHQID